MSYTISTFDRAMKAIKPLPTNQLKELYRIVCDETLEYMLDFLEEQKCITEAQKHTLFDGMIMWDDGKGSSWEEDEEIYNEILDKVGFTQDLWEAFERLAWVLDEAYVWEL